MLTTWKFRIKDGGSAGRTLSRMARSVNMVWNFAKTTQRDALRAKSARLIEDKKSGTEVAIPNFLSSAELDALVAGSSKELGLHSQTVQAITQEYSTRRKQFGKLLRWRGRKSLGWVPFKASGLKWGEESVTYCGKRFRYWNSRSLPDDAAIKCGRFTQDSRGRWYVSIAFESELLRVAKGDAEVGVDPGIKTLATISDGTKVDRPNLRAKYLLKMRRLERTRKAARRRQAKSKRYGRLPKARQFAGLAAGVAQTRVDYLHKESTKLIARTRTIVMGNLSCRFVNRNPKLSGISLDSGLGMFRGMLRYKAQRAGATYVEVSERDSTQTCSNCGWRHPQRIGLGVRQWTCGGCAVEHDRDINAARNILAAYRPSPAQDVVRCPTSPPKRRCKPRESSASKHGLSARV
jgi:IS605 OrfB family transposase